MMVLDLHDDATMKNTKNQTVVKTSDFSVCEYNEQSK